MLIDRKQIPWMTATLLLAAAGGVGAWLDPESGSRVHSGSTWVGLALGSAALAMMLFCAGLALKRRVPHWRIGRAQSWLRGHVWLGLLAVWFVGLHSAFRLGGPMTTWLWLLLGLITLSALFGVLLQQFIPRLLLHGVPGETLAQQLDRQLAALSGLVEQVVTKYAGSIDGPTASPRASAGEPEPVLPALAGDPGAAVAPAARPAPAGAPAPPSGGEPLRRFYLDYARAFFAGDPNSVLRSTGRVESLFVALRTMTPPQVHPGVDALRDLCDRRRQLLRQRRLMRLLFAWLLVHVPLSWGLLVLVIAHAVSALRFVPR